MNGQTDSTKSRSSRLVRLVPVWMWLCFGTAYVAFLAHNVVDMDLWHQMALVREAFALGGLPANDLFAYTPTVTPSVHHEWGAGFLAYVSAKLLGAPGVLILKYLVGIGIAVFVLLCVRQRAVPLSLLSLCMPVTLILLQRGLSTVRAQMYSFFFVAMLFWMLDQDRRDKRWWIYLAHLFLYFG